MQIYNPCYLVRNVSEMKLSCPHILCSSSTVQQSWSARISFFGLNYKWKMHSSNTPNPLWHSSTRTGPVHCKSPQTCAPQRCCTLSTSHFALQSPSSALFANTDATYETYLQSCNQLEYHLAFMKASWFYLLRALLFNSSYHIPQLN